MPFLFMGLFIFLFMGYLAGFLWALYRYQSTAQVGNWMHQIHAKINRDKNLYFYKKYQWEELQKQPPESSLSYHQSPPLIQEYLDNLKQERLYVVKEKKPLLEQSIKTLQKEAKPISWEVKHLSKIKQVSEITYELKNSLLAPISSFYPWIYDIENKPSCWVMDCSLKLEKLPLEDHFYRIHCKIMEKTSS